MTASNIHFFTEGRIYSANSTENKAIFSFIKKHELGRKFIETIDDRKKLVKLKVCGLMIINDIAVVVFPKDYIVHADKNNVKEHARLLFRTFQRYMNEHSNTLESQQIKTSDDEIDTLSHINEIVYILRDYRQNGFLVRKTTHVSQYRTGRIMWNKTIRQTMSLISDGNVIYPSPYMKSSQTVRNKLIQHIHRHLVCKFRHDWGWLDDDDFPAERVPDEPCSPDEAINVLCQELQTAYNQREIALIKCMIRYYKKISGQDAHLKADFMLTTNTDNIWEQVCKDVLGDVYNDIVKDVVPKPYKVRANSTPEKMKGIIPDLLCIRNRKMYVLDAKNYDLTATYPHWADFTKQFFYLYTIKERLNNIANDETISASLKQKYAGITPVANALLMPSYNDSCEDDYIYRLHSTVNIPWTPSLGCIFAYQLNTRRMFQAYTAKTGLEDIRQSLFNELDSQTIHLQQNV